MIVEQTPEFARWLARLKDREAAARIAVRLLRASRGNLGAVKNFGGFSEMKIDHGPGYRLYFTQRGDRLIVLLCGGTKKTQARDMNLAAAMAKEIE